MTGPHVGRDSSVPLPTSGKANPPADKALAPTEKGKTEDQTEMLPEAATIPWYATLDSRESVLKGGDTGPAITPGKPATSLLLKVVSAAKQTGARPRDVRPGPPGNARVRHALPDRPVPGRAPGAFVQRP